MADEEDDQTNKSQESCEDVGGTVNIINNKHTTSKNGKKMNKRNQDIPDIVVETVDDSSQQKEEGSNEEKTRPMQRIDKEVEVKIPDGGEEREGNEEEREGNEEDGEEREGNEEEGEDEVVEEEEEMLPEEKEEMYNAVVAGDIDLLEDLLNKPNADINMIWFNQNLLVAALRSQQEEMAEFLLDNGVDYNFKSVLIDMKDERSRHLQWYNYSCRQMAYDLGMLDIVQLIDLKNGNLFSFIRPRKRVPRYRKPKPPTPPPTGSDEEFTDSEQSWGKQTEKSENTSGDGTSKEETEIPGIAEREDKTKVSDTPEVLDIIETKDEAKVRDKTERMDTPEVSDMMDPKDKTKDEDKAEIYGKTEAGNKTEETGKSKTKDQTVVEEKSDKRTELTDNWDTDSGHHSIVSTTASDHDMKVKIKDFVRISPKVEKLPKRLDTCITIFSDEGYATLTPKSSPCWSPSSKPDKTQPKRKLLSSRPTRSSLALQKSVQLRKPACTDDRPLQKRKVTIIGSYASESQNWHTSSSCRQDDLNDWRRHSFVTTNNVRLVQGDVKLTQQKQEANYMKMTTSAFTKRKLLPNFTRCYTSLEFFTEKKLTKKQYNVCNRSQFIAPSIGSRGKATGCLERVSTSSVQRKHSPRGFSTYQASYQMPPNRTLMKSSW